MFRRTFSAMMRDMFHRKEFYIALCIFLLLFLGTAVVSLAGLWGTNRNFLYAAWCYWGNEAMYAHTRFAALGFNMMIFLLPFCAGLAYSFSYFDARKNRALLFQITRTGRSNYFLSAMLTAFCGSFLLVFIPMVLTLVFCCIAYPVNSPQIFSQTASTDVTINQANCFRALYLNHPYWARLLYCFFFSLVSGLMGMLPLSISFFFKKSRFIILTLPGIVWSVSWYFFIMTSQGINTFALLASTNDCAFSPANYLVFLLILLGLNLAAVGFKLLFAKDEL